MKKICFTALIAALVIVSINCAYNCGKIQQRQDDYHLYGYLFSNSTIENKAHYDAMCIEPDSIYYCDDCKKVILDYGHEDHSHEKIEHKLVKMFRAYE